MNPEIPFLEIDTLYGEPRAGATRTPYDAFGVRLRFGGGSSFSEAKVRGQLAGFPIGDGGLHFSVIQSYDFQKNDAYSTGAQSFEGALGYTRPLSQRNSMFLFAWGGATVLGAIDSLPLGVTEVPEEEEEEEEEGGDAGQGVSKDRDTTTMGPAGTSASPRSSHDRRPFTIVSYQGRHLYSLDGVRANHFLQRPPGRPAGAAAPPAWPRCVRGVFHRRTLLSG